MTGFYRFGKAVCNIFCAIAFRVEVHGTENLPKEGGFILASNHVTEFDPVLLGIKIKRQLNFMAKIELFRNKLFGAVIKGLGAFPVSRGTGDTSAIDKAIDTVEKGNVLAIFPEGTRSKDGELRRFKSGAIVVAEKTGADIIPTGIYIKDFQKGLRFRSKVIVRYGKLIPNGALKLDVENPSTIKKASNLVRDAVAQLLEESK
jgi:1-acyl-sn-glycerol-3-phosphate acyltransferase